MSIEDDCAHSIGDCNGSCREVRDARVAELETKIDELQEDRRERAKGHRTDAWCWRAERTKLNGRIAELEEHESQLENEVVYWSQLQKKGLESIAEVERREKIKDDAVYVYEEKITELEKMNANQAQTIGCLVDKNVENARLREALERIKNCDPHPDLSYQKYFDAMKYIRVVLATLEPACDEGDNK